MAKSKIDKKRYPAVDYEGQLVSEGFVSLNEQNRKRLEFFFPSEQIEMLVNDVVDNALTDFIVTLEHLDNKKFMQYYERMVEDEEHPEVDLCNVEDDEE